MNPTEAQMDEEEAKEERSPVEGPTKKALNWKDIDNIFTYHTPKGSQQQRYEALREHARKFARLVLESCHDSREKSIALTKIQEAVMWANASIAINE